MAPIRLALECFLDPAPLPFLLARHEGWLQEARIERRLVEPSRQLDAQAALQSNGVDVRIEQPSFAATDPCFPHDPGMSAAS